MWAQNLIVLACLLSFFLFNLSSACLAQDGQLFDLEQKKFNLLFAELEHQYGFTAEQLRAIFQGMRIDRQVLVLMDKQWEAKPYHQYAPLFLTAENINQGKEMLRQHAQVLGRVEATFGVDRETIVAIWGVETKYGAHEGNFYVLQTLLTLFDAYPRRADFFRGQLIDFLLLCRENRMDPRVVKGSYAAAFGQTQFIPSSFREYAVSFDGDDRRDVWNSVPDILASIANYLKRHQWTFKAPVYAELGSALNDWELRDAEQQGRKAKVPHAVVCRLQGLRLPPSPGDRPLTIVGLELPPGSPFPKRFVAAYPNFQAITEWNHSNRYAMVVSELAEAIGR